VDEKRQFESFKNNLLLWNKRMNLTAIVDDADIQIKHFNDSLTLVSLLPAGNIRMIDVGAGAGFPSIPLKIMRPDIRLTLLDSLRKRIDFLTDTVSLLGLENTVCIHARAEDLQKQSEHKNSYDICVARAVAKLDKLCAWCIPFLKPDGRFIAMKGPNVHAELEEAQNTIERLGAVVADIHYFELAEGLVHSAIVIKKTSGSGGVPPAGSGAGPSGVWGRAPRS